MLFYHTQTGYTTTCFIHIRNFLFLPRRLQSPRRAHIAFKSRRKKEKKKKAFCNQQKVEANEKITDLLYSHNTQNIEWV